MNLAQLKKSITELDQDQLEQLILLRRKSRHTPKPRKVTDTKEVLTPFQTLMSQLETMSLEDIEQLEAFIKGIERKDDLDDITSDEAEDNSN